MKVTLYTAIDRDASTWGYGLTPLEARNDARQNLEKVGLGGLANKLTIGEVTARANRQKIVTLVCSLVGGEGWEDLVEVHQYLQRSGVDAPLPKDWKKDRGGSCGK